MEESCQPEREEKRERYKTVNTSTLPGDSIGNVTNIVILQLFLWVGLNVAFIRFIALTNWKTSRFPSNSKRSKHWREA